jgi:hypothetical protein
MWGKNRVSSNTKYDYTDRKENVYGEPIHPIIHLPFKMPLTHSGEANI